MLLEDSRWRKLPELMAHHVFGHKDRVKNLPVMNEKRMPNEIGRNGRATRPGLDWLLGTGVVLLVDFLEQVEVNERAFF